MEKLDLKKELKSLYQPSAKEVVTIDVPAMNFLMVDGEGNPNGSQEFKDAIAALYGVSYKLKFMWKNGQNPVDYSVMPLEGLWWAEDMERFSVDRKEEWKWTLMILQPEFVTAAQVSEAIAVQKKKKPTSAVGKLRFEEYREGLAAQILHLGPFSAERPTVDKLHDYIASQGYQLSGLHHEIYLSDAMKTAPEKLKTIIRQPMAKG